MITINRCRNIGCSCERCGKPAPIDYNASKWEKIIPKKYKTKILCIDCYLIYFQLAIPAGNRSKIEETLIFTDQDFYLNGRTTL